MSLLKQALNSLLRLAELVGSGGTDKVAKILRDHLNLTAYQLAETYQSSYFNTLEAIRRSCAPRWVDWRSQIEKQFSDQVRIYYLIEFANEKHWTDTQLAEFKQQIAAECDRVLKLKTVIFEPDGQLFDEQALAALLTTKNLLSLTQLTFERLNALKITVSPNVVEFLRYRDLLGKGIEFFVRNNPKIINRLAALQQAGLWDTVQEVKQIVESLQQAGIRPKIEAEDEFKTYDSASIQKVGQAIVLLRNQLFKPEDQGKALLMAGTAIFALNALDEAKQLLEQALQLAQRDEERALVHFNLFQVYLRYSQPNYNEIAFEHLQTALSLDSAKTFYFYEPRKYNLLKLLGAGGMGCAFLAEDLSFDRQVVLKSFWKTFERETRDIFREVLAMKKVSRQFVPEPFGVEFYGHHAYLLTEYIENALDGEQWLREKGRLNSELAIDVAWQIATGLHAAHEQGVLHLDLKPANVLLVTTADRVVVKLIDFGLAKVVTPLHTQVRRTQRQSTQFGTRIAGTWDYAPPEQRGVTQFKPSAKSDVFAFGKTMMRLCSGKEPQNCRERDVPEVLRELLFDCVEENPAQRPEFEKILARFGRDSRESVPEKSPSSEVPASKPSEESSFFKWMFGKTTPSQENDKKHREQEEHLRKLQAQREREEREFQKRQKEIGQKQQEEAARLKKLQEQREREEQAWQQQQAELTRKQQEENERLKKLQAQREREAQELQQRQAREAEEQCKLGELFEFDVIIDNAGQEIKRVRGKNYQKVYDLGKGVKVELVYIPAGEFMMGSPDGQGDSDEHPRHKVVIAKPFYMGKYPVTQEQWEAVTGKNPSYFKGKKLPVEQVSWNDMKEFCKQLSQRLGEKFDLPSEAMWEYACRAGSVTRYSFGEIITPELANYSISGIKQTTEVGKYPANAFGLYDMHGNVLEWCEDVWHENYVGAPSDGSAWMAGGDSNKHLLRGGSWGYSDNFLRCAYRVRYDTTPWSYLRGFRLSRM